MTEASVAMLGVMAALVVVALRLPPEDIARAAVDLSRSVWVLISAILATTTIALLWTLKIHASSLRDEPGALVKGGRMRQGRLVLDRARASLDYHDARDPSIAGDRDHDHDHEEVKT